MFHGISPENIAINMVRLRTSIKMDPGDLPLKHVTIFAKGVPTRTCKGQKTHEFRIHKPPAGPLSEQC